MPAYHVYRSTVIDASPEKVFDAVADFSTWTTWSPWLCAEPDAEVNVSADSSSVGSLYSWQGEVVGQGEIEHTKLEPGKLIEEEIRFIKPFKSVSAVWFELEPSGDSTKITWHMRGKLPWFLFWMTPMMEGFIGMDYERGLRMLKEWLETGRILSDTKIRGKETVGPLHMVGVRKTSSMSDLGPSMETAIREATEAFQSAGLTIGEGISVYHDFKIKTQIFDYTSGFVVEAVPENLPAGLNSWSISEMSAFAVEHVGAYEHLGNGWSAAHQHVRNKKGLKPSKVGGYERYKNNPCDTPPEDLRTEIYIPLR